MRFLLNLITLPFALIMSLMWGLKNQPGDPRYEAWLSRYGYEAQYQAYLKAHGGSNEGFVYRDPGDMPKDWTPGS